MHPNETNDDGCGCRETRRRYKILRALLLLAGLSLAIYMPWKAFTQYESLSHIYGPWFLQGMVVAAAGVLFTWRLSFASRLPLILRVAIAASAVLWMRTGLACTPHLWNTIQTALGPGLFAWFHMFAQHVFLSLGVIAFSVAPAWMGSRLGGTAEAGTPFAEQPVA